MKIIKFEGAVEEFKAVAHLFGDMPPSELVVEGSEVEPNMKPQDAIRCMLTRIPISDGQMAVYKALSSGRVEYNELLRQTGRTSGTMAGVLGALGRRINTTKEIHLAGLKGSTEAILNWEIEGDKGYYSLTPQAIEALRSEGVI